MLSLHNTLTLQKEPFKPINKENIRIYVCGNTVYGSIHIGNARPMVVFDILFRLLKNNYGEQNVTYVRNITDVDDKIIKASLENKESINELTTRIIKESKTYEKSLGCQNPTIEPRATEHIKEIIDMITILINKGYANFINGHVYFDVTKFNKYGSLSHNKLEDLIGGARVEVVTDKTHPANFVLWKPSEPNVVGWDSPWGFGRPGWHIECSAMSLKYLGETFDIHGGGQDLIFPHHENERAQSICACETTEFANYWLHNGLIMVDGRKMSKSLGNFFTIKDLLKTYAGEDIRYAILSSQYRATLDFSITRMEQAKSTIKGIRQILGDEVPNLEGVVVSKNFMEAMNDDMNTPVALRHLHDLIKDYKTKPSEGLRKQIFKDANLIGLLEHDREEPVKAINSAEVESKIEARAKAKAEKDYKLADEIRQELELKGIMIEDTKNGTKWSVK